MNAEQRLAKGATWFYWIAAFSLVNAVLTLLNAGLRMVIGMGLTDLIDVLPQIASHNAPLSAGGIIFIIVGNLIVSGIMAGFGWLSLRRQTWAMILGTLVYLADAGILLLSQDWYGLAFHAFVLYQLVNGIKACFDLKAAPASTPPPAPSEGAA